MRARILLYVTFAVTVTGCAGNAFDRHMANRRWTDAAAAFAADSSLRDNERTLHRAALLYASPSLDTYDPVLARELLMRLLSRNPNTIHRESALRMMELLDRIELERAQHAARERALERECSRIEEDLIRLTTQLADMEKQLQTRKQENELLRQSVERLQGIVRDRETQLRQLREELERLKAIDLRIPPGSGGISRM